LPCQKKQNWITPLSVFWRAKECNEESAMEQDRYPPNYRSTEARQVMGWIKAGQSGCLVGLRGAGKSYFLYFLVRQDVRQRYLGPNWADFIFVLVDLLALTEYTEWAACELMLDRLLGQLCPPTIEPKVAEEMRALHQEAVRTRDLFTAERALERCVGALCQRPTRRVVLLFSKFDTVFRTLDASLFRCLRAIQNAHKGQVSYVVAVANYLASLRDDLTQVDPFYRLVSRNVCSLGPSDAADASYMIHYESAQRSAALSKEDTARLIALSGGHAGLIKAILSLLWDVRYGGKLEELAPALSDEPAVQAECRKVWGSLSEGEQAGLCALVSEGETDPRALRQLAYRGLIRESQSPPFIFSPLFADFVRWQAPPPAGGTVINRSPMLVQIKGRHIKGLTELEFETLHYLYARRGHVCTKDELIKNVYRQQYDRMKGGVSDEALQALISRLRDKVEPDRRRPRHIVTVRGAGYKFVEPDEQ
jgi:DNA-binding winged helix-turn-helix (wHTH) protein